VYKKMLKLQVTYCKQVLHYRILYYFIVNQTLEQHSITTCYSPFTYLSQPESHVTQFRMAEQFPIQNCRSFLKYQEPV